MRSPILALFLSLAMTGSLCAQFRDAEPQGVKMGDSKSFRWRAGLIITATGGECKAITGYAPIPTDWPEQQVKIVDEDISPGVHVDYKIIDGTVKIMTVKIGATGIRPGGQGPGHVVDQTPSDPSARRHRHLRASRCEKAPPGDSAISGAQPEDREPRCEDSQPVEANYRRQGKGMEKVEAIYDWTREHVKYKEGMPLRGAIAALKDGTGDCEDMTSLFIALCRAGYIPSRTVWVQGHCYPEFYLEDDKGEGHWFPCQAAGSRQFGGITEDRPILQKGDNFKPLNGKGERQRYLAEFLTGAETGGKPRVTPVRELLGAEKTDN